MCPSSQLNLKGERGQLPLFDKIAYSSSASQMRDLCQLKRHILQIDFVCFGGSNAASYTSRTA